MPRLGEVRGCGAMAVRCPLTADFVEEVGFQGLSGADAWGFRRQDRRRHLRPPGSASLRGLAWRVSGGSGRWRQGGIHRGRRSARV